MNPDISFYIEEVEADEAEHQHYINTLTDYYNYVQNYGAAQVAKDLARIVKERHSTVEPYYFH